MIVKLLLDFLSAIVTTVIGWFPTSAPPGWVSDGAGYVAQMLGYGSGIGAWIPWALMGTVLAAVFVALGIGFSIRLVRVVASFFTGGGGSAA